MNLQWKFNETESFIVFEEGKALCSSKNPIKEAQQWLGSRDLSRSDDIMILGLGAGYHVVEALKFKKFNSVSVVESNAELIQAFEKNFPEEFEKVQFYMINSNSIIDQKLFQFLGDRQPTVLAFRPAWGSRSSNFEDLFAKMTFRNLQMIKRFLDENHLSQSVSLDKIQQEKNVLHLKNIYENLQEVSSPFGVSVQLLKELWV
jgi:hypothetical protein